MVLEPAFTPDDDEQKLLESDPEECFRRAVRRGALSLDQFSRDLPPRVAAAVRSIAAGERLPASSADADPARTVADVSRMLSNHPQLTQMLGGRLLTLDEAIEAAHAIDHALGRYLTGTRYAAP
jgi:hypothetical protein